MCGIIGFAGKDPKLASQMLASIEHRGPDDEGMDCDESFSFGNRRLAVIDLSPNGHQPMWSEDRQFGIAYNGELYNYRELKEELELKGVRFQTASDTEVILRGFREEGLSFFGKMRGMWAAALYDRARGTVTLVRDPFGIKPLFYFSSNGRFAFASEMKALGVFCKDRGIRLHLSDIGCSSYFTFGYAMHPHTVFEEIRALTPATAMTVSLKDGAMSSVAVPFDESRTPASLEEALKESVRAHLVADVPVGVFLSGGLDSTLIALILKELNVPLHAFTMSMEGREDASYASAVAKFSGLTHHVVELTPELLAEGYEEFFAAVDAPVADTAIIPSLILSREARKTVTCVLTGEGGDELFYGYERYDTLAPLTRVREAPGFFERAHAPLGSRVLQSLLRRLRLIEARMRNDLLEAYRETAGIGGSAARATALMEALRAESSGERPMSFFDETYYLPDALLYKNDIATMAHSLEGRTPFLDRIVAKYAKGLSATEKLNGDGRKVPLRSLLKEKLPPELIMPGKSGFGVPRKLLRPFLERDFPEAARRLSQMRPPGLTPAFLAALKNPAFQETLYASLPAFPFAAVVFTRTLARYDVAYD